MQYCYARTEHICVASFEVIKLVNACKVAMQRLNTSVLFHFKVYVVNICVLNLLMMHSCDISGSFVMQLLREYRCTSVLSVLQVMHILCH